MKPTLYDAIHSLQKYASFGMLNDDYDTLEWYDDESVVPKPTKEEAFAELARLQAEYERQEYQRKRAEAYPPIQAQLDTIFHHGLDVWREQIQAVKDKFPKP